MNVMYKELKFYKKAEELTLEIYQVTAEFPKSELYGLTSQLRRASSSICSNIAEGAGRETLLDYKRFLIQARGSAKEIEYQLKLAKDLKYISISTYDRLLVMINAILGPLTNYIKKIVETINNG